MNGWVKAGVSFPQRAVRFYLPLENVADGLLSRTLGGSGPPTAEAEEALLWLIGDFRPEFSGGVLFAVRLDFARMAWEFVYAHPAMPRVSEGEELPRVPLDPWDEVRAATPIVREGTGTPEG